MFSRTLKPHGYADDEAPAPGSPEEKAVRSGKKKLLPFLTTLTEVLKENAIF